MKIRDRDGNVRDKTPEEIARDAANHQADLARAEAEQALLNLKELDTRTIRAMREELAPNNPRIKALEDEAAAERAKLQQR